MKSSSVSEETKDMKKEDESIDFKPIGVWNIYPDPEAEAISSKWWHKLLFWKKWKYQDWKVKREYKSLKEMMDEI